jgi:hypothetical protein
VNLFKRISRGFLDIALTPFYRLEIKERNRRLEERVKRSLQKQKRL